MAPFGFIFSTITQWLNPEFVNFKMGFPVSEEQANIFIFFFPHEMTVMIMSVSEGKVFFPCGKFCCTAFREGGEPGFVTWRVS